MLRYDYYDIFIMVHKKVNEMYMYPIYNNLVLESTFIKAKTKTLN